MMRRLLLASPLAVLGLIAMVAGVPILMGISSDGTGSCGEAGTVVEAGQVTRTDFPDLAGPTGPAGRQSTLPITPERQANVTAIVSVALAVFHDDPITTTNEPLRAAVIGVATAMQESTLQVIDRGDAAGPDSRGLFQQRAGWGPYAARMDPVQSAVYFFTGGDGGQKGLQQIVGWQSMTLTQAAQAVQVSAFGSAYAKWETQAMQLVDAARDTTPADLTAGVDVTGGAPVAACGALLGGGALTADGAIIPPGLVAKTDWPHEAATVLDPTGTGGRVTPRAAALVAALTAGGFAPSGISCWDAHAWNPTSDHPRGLACDVFFAYPAQVAQGWGTANWLVANQAQLGVKYLIWQGLYWDSIYPSTWTTYESSIYGCPNPAEITGCHYDHVHVSLY